MLGSFGEWVFCKIDKRPVVFINDFLVSRICWSVRGMEALDLMSIHLLKLFRLWPDHDT